MTAAVLDAPGRAFPEGCPSDARGGGSVTLEKRLQRAWRLLLAQGAVECPVCGSEMRLRGSAGECGGCGTKMT